MDTLAEWLRRRPAKPMGSTRAGSNPAGVAFAHSSCCDVSPTPHQLTARRSGCFIQALVGQLRNMRPERFERPTF